MFRTPDDQLPKKLFFGQVKGRRPPGCPRLSFNESDVAVRDCQLHKYCLQGCSEQIALEGQDLPCRYLAHYELESVTTIVIYYQYFIISIILVVIDKITVNIMCYGHGIGPHSVGML